MSEKIKLVSRVNRHVTIYAPEYRFVRTFDKAGQSFIIDKDTLDQILYLPGIRQVFERGIITIEDKAARVEYGLEAEDEEGNIDFAVEVLTPEDILDKLKNTDYKEFKTYFEDLDSEKQKRFVDVAVENKFLDYAKCALIKRITGRDIAKIIEITSDEEPEEEEE